MRNTNLIKYNEVLNFIMDLKLNDILNISEQNQWKFKVKFNN